MTALWCAICLGTDGLVRSDDGVLECVRCRTEHPRSGRYGFDDQRPEAHGAQAPGCRQSKARKNAS